MNSAIQAATAATISVRQDWLYKGLAKLNAAGEQLPPDATDHAIVFDPISGLMEAINAPGFDADLTHDAATKLAAKLSFAGFSDWQLPDVPEGVHAVEYSRRDPAADVSLYPDAVATWYWTRQQTSWTRRKAGASRSFFYVSMSYGYVYDSYAYSELRARPVRRAWPASQCSALGQA